MAGKCILMHQHTYTHIYNSGDQLCNESVASCPGNLGKSIEFSIKKNDSNKKFTVEGWYHCQCTVTAYLWRPIKNVKIHTTPFF